MSNRLPNCRKRIVRYPFLLVAGIVLLVGLLPGCRPAPLATLQDVIAESPGQPTPVEQADSSIEPAGDGVADLIPTPTLRSQASPAASPEAAITLSPTPEPSPLATQVPTPTPIGPCSMRIPVDDLFAVVTLTYGLSRDFAPEDLVPLSDELPMHVTMGYPSEIREVAFQPLVQMINDMQEEGLHPRVLSAYRSYAAQSFAWDKWNRLYPERAAIISAPPGHSEHQLGTVVDFGSPELASIVGQADIEFHTYFYKTSEGIWLAENAHRYGFTLSFPAEASEFSGFYYEPWHFRYVGLDMATLLYEMGSSLIEFQLAKQPVPCNP